MESNWVLDLYVRTYSHNVVDTSCVTDTLGDVFTVSNEQELGIYVVLVATVIPTLIRLGYTHNVDLSDESRRKNKPGRDQIKVGTESYETLFKRSDGRSWQCGEGIWNKEPGWQQQGPIEARTVAQNKSRRS
jgi:hypothetical protein